MSQALLLGLTLVATSFMVCAAVALVFTGLAPRRAARAASMDISEQDAVFVFRDDALVDSSDRGKQLLSSIVAASQDKQQELDHLLVFLERRFADLRQHLGQLVAVGEVELVAEDGSGLVLKASRKKGLTHLRLTDTRAEGSLVALDRLSFEAMREELDTLRGVVKHMPVLSWRQDAAGQVTWANSAYISAFLAVDAGRSGLSWPLPDLFAGQEPDEHARLSLDMENHVAWFGHAVISEQTEKLHFATPIDLAVQTESARRQMMQVLTRTFSSLPTGLALFDTERRLQVFNPALVDLLGLDPLFLAARPSFEQFLFTLREMRMLPEPKDFATWRRNISDMERAAETGVFSEEWCLDNGRIYHVTGRPQPGGALAFFFDDITSEATLTRNLRAEIELSQTVVDGLQDAVVAFNACGDTLLSNALYSKIWGEDPCNNLADRGVRDALDLWSKACAPTGIWQELRDFVVHAQTGADFTGSVCLLDGTTLALHARRMRQDCLLITFRPLVQSRTREAGALLRQAKTMLQPDILQIETSPKDETSPFDRQVAEKLAAAIPRKSRVVQHASSRSRS